jgi:hypothetical protein
MQPLSMCQRRAGPEEHPRTAPANRRHHSCFLNRDRLGVSAYPLKAVPTAMTRYEWSAANMRILRYMSFIRTGGILLPLPER